MNGFGKLIFENGDTFEGQFDNDTVCGIGEYQSRKKS